MAKPEYSCSQSSLYATCRIMWTNYALNQSAFAAFKPRYTIAYGTAALLAIDNAQMMPDDQARGTAAEMAKLNLQNTYGPDALWKWQMLKSHIEEAYGDLAKPQLEAAGWMYYGQASNNNWEKVTQMMANGAAYLAEAANVAALTANNNMPPSFVATFGASKAALDAEYLVFKGSQSGQKPGTVSKIEANNAIYQDAIRLSKDAALVFRNAPETAGMMVYAEMLRLVDGGSSTPAFEQTYTVAAGANLTINDFVLTATTNLLVTLLTDAGPSVHFCRNLLAGCAGDGKLLIYNTVVEALGMELPGDDLQVVLSNSTAMDVQVKVKLAVA